MARILDILFEPQEEGPEAWIEPPAVAFEPPTTAAPTGQTGLADSARGESSGNVFPEAWVEGQFN